MADLGYKRYYVYIKPVIGNKYVKSTAPYIFSVLAITIFIIFAIRPTVLTIINLQKSIQDNEQVLNTLEQKSRDLTEGKINLDNIDQSVKTKINTRLPDNAAVALLINDLQIAATKNASISALQIQPVTIYTNASGSAVKKNLGELSFSFNVQGSYADLLSTLNNISKSPRLINLTGVILNKSSEGTIGMSVNGKAYYLKE